MNKAQIENLKNSLDSANIFMEELEKKDEILKQFKAQSNHFFQRKRYTYL